MRATKVGYIVIGDQKPMETCLCGHGLCNRRDLGLFFGQSVTIFPTRQKAKTQIKHTNERMQALGLKPEYRIKNMRIIPAVLP